MLKTRVLTLTFILCALFATASFVRAEDPAPTEPAATFESAFQSGLAAYQKQDYAAAQASFVQALTLRPDENSTLFNLGLTASRMGQRGWSLGYFRRVLAQDPGHSEARQALNFSLKQNPPREIPHQIETWETLHASVLSLASLATFAFLSLLIFFAAAWTWLTYLGARNRALKAETALPAPPILAIAFTLVLAAALTLTGAKVLDLREARATIVLEKVSAQTAPSDQAPSLFDLFEGLEVLVRQVKGDWIQVTYPGAMTGWVPKNSLFVTQGAL